MFKSLKPQKWTVLFKKKSPSFLSNVCHSFLKLKKFLRLMIKRSKGLELIKIFFIISLNTFGLTVFLILQFVDFENVTLKFFLNKK
jgi:hypothetical protein